ncbi:diguanylate cyclase domain-containing protein [Xylophilus sp. GOD-11R]|uniref:diguanylate cyclase domain-containing protein n=1 Tax=Xylophilus sp. GOD-11R TaxID=3089814 RepID=UPI00298C86DF|nr:diguanylate cyclase [Xylophilus sp. GOD-11R]WPB57247.1 diguanylate cyclase [Xylophilus sp. GOD-11R]
MPRRLKFSQQQRDGEPAAPPGASPVPRVRVLRLADVLPIVMLGLTAAAWVAAGWHEQSLAARDAQKLAERTVEAANERVQRHFDLAMGLGGLLRVGEGLSRREFHDQYETQEIATRFPAVVALQYAPLVPAQDRARFEASVRADRSMVAGGYPNFAIHPDGDRASFMPILYNEPDGLNQRAFGFDASSAPPLREVQERARDSGRPELSGLTALVQGGRAVLLRYAVYQRGSSARTVEERRGNYRGQLGMVLDMPSMMAGLLEPGEQHWRVRIEDVGRADEPGESDLLFHSAPPGEIYERTAPPLVRDLLVGGRAWRFTFERDAGLPWLGAVPLAVATGGIALSLLLVVVARGFRRNYETVAQRERRSRHDALHDYLTGLPNRGFFEQTLQRALERAAERHERVALLFIDLDHFKRINDAHGHAVGDAVLRNVAERLQNTLRGGDTVARLGGDEFVVLLPQVRDGTWQLTAQRVHDAMSHPISDGELQLWITLSIGVAVFPDDAGDAATLMRRADGAMYRAKRAALDT